MGLLKEEFVQQLPKLTFEIFADRDINSQQNLGRIPTHQRDALTVCEKMIPHISSNWWRNHLGRLGRVLSLCHNFSGKFKIFGKSQY